MADVVNFLEGEWWYGINALALIFTLIVVIFYTKATRKMAKATYAMSNVTEKSTDYQKEDMQFRKRPVVSILCANENELFFPTIVHNFSYIHAKARIKATIFINGKELTLEKNNHYNGKIIWQLQAVGPNGSPFVGHLNLVNLITREFNIKDTDLCNIDAKVTFEMWTINYFDNEKDLYNDINKNPLAQWIWSKERQRWIPEIAPKL